MSVNWCAKLSILKHKLNEYFSLNKYVNIQKKRKEQNTVILWSKLIFTYYER